MNQDCVFERTNFNGVIQTKLRIVRKEKPLINGVKLQRWNLVIYILVISLLSAILGASIHLGFFSKPPASYGENCQGRSCFSNINLKCINNTCQCLKNEYYSDKCIKKGINMETCNRMYQCETEKGLICLNGKCQCNSTHYWKDKLCMAKKSFGENCGSEKCSDDLMLVCDSNGICSCSEERSWNGFVCMRKRLFEEKCFYGDACSDKQELKCINGTCKLLSFLSNVVILNILF
jgi:hypothetical protein